MARRKLLITGGCSYTDRNFMSNDSSLPAEKRSGWAMWPEYLGNALDLDVMNTAKSGSSNQTIFHNVLEQIYLYRDRVDTVAVMWSGMDRTRIMCGYDLNPISEVQIISNNNPGYKDGEGSPFEWMEKLGIGNLSYNFFTSQDFFKVRAGFIKYAIEDSLRSFNTLADLCSMYGIKFVFISGLMPFDYPGLSDFENKGLLQCPRGESVSTHQAIVLRNYVNNIWFSKYDRAYKSNFIGWPMFAPLGGTYLDEMRWNDKNLFPKSDKYNVSEIDGHPNAEAQEIISNVILEKHRELYG